MKEWIYFLSNAKQEKGKGKEEGFLVDGTQERKRGFQLSFVREEYDLCRSCNHKVLKQRGCLKLGLDVAELTPFFNL